MDWDTPFAKLLETVLSLVWANPREVVSKHIKEVRLCSLRAKWEVFNSTGLACDLDSPFAEVIPFAGAALLHRKCCLHLGKHSWEEGARGEFTPAMPATCVRGKPVHSDFVLTHRCNKKESNQNTTSQHTSPSGIEGSSLMYGEAVTKAPASSQ